MRRGQRQEQERGEALLASHVACARPGRALPACFLLRTSRPPRRPAPSLPRCTEARWGGAPHPGPVSLPQPHLAPCSPCPTTTPGCCSTSSPSCSSSASLCSTCSWAWWWRTSTSAGSTRRPRRRGGERRNGSGAWRGSAGVRRCQWRWWVGARAPAGGRWDGRGSREPARTGSEAGSPSHLSAVGARSCLPSPVFLSLPGLTLPNDSARCLPCLGLRGGQALQGPGRGRQLQQEARGSFQML